MAVATAKKVLVIFIFIHILPLAISCAQTVGNIPQKVPDVFIPDGDEVDVKVWVERLVIPWSLVFLPDERALVSERPGRIRLIIKGVLLKTPYATLDVTHIGEGGLMGLAIHPEFPRKPYIYAMYTYRRSGELFNRVIRIKDNGLTGTFDKVIIDTIPGGRLHDGGRIAFGPDGMLYVTTGETFHSELAQDLNSLGGKILRVTPEGKVPEDNPFKGLPIYSYGHRNPQGLAWDSRGSLFESEHGPSGEFGRFGHDEINIIVRGGNYGWPKVIGAGRIKPYIDPIIVWEKATPPSGITFYKGNLFKHLQGGLFVATLRSQSLIRVRLDESYRITRIERWFSAEDYKGKYGRIRDVVEGPDGSLYFLTSNRDGRGNPLPGDDKIYRILPKRY